MNGVRKRGMHTPIHEHFEQASNAPSINKGPSATALTRPVQRGFTLIELLVVMILMAVLSAAAISTLSFSFGEQDVETEARRLAALLGLASEEALLTGREIGLELNDQQLGFYFFDDLEQRWLSFEQDGPFRQRQLPESITPVLVLEGQPATLAAADDADEDDDQPEPQILMFSSGQMTPFTLTLESGDTEQRWHLEADLLGRIEVKVEE